MKWLLRIRKSFVFSVLVVPQNADKKNQKFTLRPASSSPCSTAPLAQLRRWPTAMEKDLCRAAASGDRTKMRRLLEQGVSPDARDEVREFLAPRMAC
jgi:hypothetical protein